MIKKIDRRRYNLMIQKLTPIIVLTLFLIGAYFMKQGMDNAVHMSKHPKKIEKKATTKP